MYCVEPFLLFCNNCSITFIWTNKLIAVACFSRKVYPSFCMFTWKESTSYVLNNHSCCFYNFLWDLSPHSASSLLIFHNLRGYQRSFWWFNVTLLQGERIWITMTMLGGVEQQKCSFLKTRLPTLLIVLLLQLTVNMIILVPQFHIISLWV